MLTPAGSRIVVLTLLTAALSVQAAPPSFMVHVVGSLEEPPPPYGPSSYVLGLNNNGRVVGYALGPSGAMRVLNWRAGANRTMSGLAAFDRTFGAGVNVLGRVVGAGQRLDASGAIVESRALKWTGGVVSDLGTLGGRHAAALAINDAEWIVGYSTLPGESEVRAFIHRNGVMSPLTTLPGAVESYAYDISNSRYIVGTAVTVTTPARPWRFRDGVVTPLPIPPGARTGAAYAVNESGVAVGTYEISLYTGAHAAVMWQDTQMIDLGNLGGALPYAVARDINNLGWVVGISLAPAGLTGFLWQEGQMYDLNALLFDPPQGLRVLSATAVNHRGQIAGSGMLEGREVAILLTPIVSGIPTPGGPGVVVVSAVLIAARRRR